MKNGGSVRQEIYNSTYYALSLRQNTRTLSSPRFPQSQTLTGHLHFRGRPWREDQNMSSMCLSICNKKTKYKWKGHLKCTSITMSIIVTKHQFLEKQNNKCQEFFYQYLFLWKKINDQITRQSMTKEISGFMSDLSRCVQVVCQVCKQHSYDASTKNTFTLIKINTKSVNKDYWQLRTKQ